ncbi:nucleotidyltransferase family protein [Allomeiothermus silvanus]|uniref:nucleotidyltransferase family protein n=1 Tax=Allomeiothermus silvanus TaxID=52022 RepID=UPI0023EF85FC|nr:nucleotidyltransferase family protein [Allomeiothermus silvanus]
MLPDEALALLKAQFPELSRRFGVASLALFGSTARGEARADSDVDVIVEFEPGARVGLFELFELKQALEAGLKCAVDVVTPDGLRPWMREKVLREAIRAA